MNVSFHVVWKDGVWHCAEEFELPHFKEGTVATLTVNHYDVTDQGLLRRLMVPRRYELDVSAGVIIRLANAVEKPKSTQRDFSVPTYSNFARVVMDKPLRVTYRTGKNPKLEPQTVYLPDLDMEVESLNIACTRLSEHFERNRQTHTHNAFESVFVFDGMQWRQLKDVITKQGVKWLLHL